MSAWLWSFLSGRLKCLCQIYIKLFYNINKYCDENIFVLNARAMEKTGISVKLLVQQRIFMYISSIQFIYTTMKQYKSNFKILVTLVITFYLKV